MKDAIMTVWAGKGLQKGCVLRSGVPTHPPCVSPRRGVRCLLPGLTESGREAGKPPLGFGKHLLRFEEREGPALRLEKKEGDLGPEN